MIDADPTLKPADLLPAIDRMWQASAAKIKSIEATADRRDGKTPVFTIDGKYVAQGWTEWTQGFQFGSAVLQYDATGDDKSLQIGWAGTRNEMHSHVSHNGVHDHGFNNLSTYGNLLRLGREGRFDMCEDEAAFYTLALQVSGAVQAGRWTKTQDGGGFIHSFNGPQSLFVDTVRSCRIQHLRKTAEYNIFYGEGRDTWDTPDQRGRTVHETLWNPASGVYRCPSTQQGYSPFSTWTRGLAWAMLGYAEQLELLQQHPELYESDPDLPALMKKAATATCDHFIEHTPTDGIPYWDEGAPGLAKMGDYRDRPAEPFNDHEPVDSSAAAIACQGLLRLGRLTGDSTYTRAGLTTLRTLLDEPYLSHDDSHQGLLLHSVYHRPFGWDHIPADRKIPCGEACMWGDYHLREAALHLQRIAKDEPYYTFFGCVTN